MAWQDRIKEAAYTSPSGIRITFKYEDVSKEIDKKTSAFEFPDADGTFIQDLGHSGRRYPLRVIFSGNDYDLDADEFDKILLERGVGKLEHPIYGTVDVVPFGVIIRHDRLKTAGNQAIIELTFWETINITFPSPQTDPSSQVLDSVDSYNAAVSEEFEDSTSLTDSVDTVTFKNKYDSLLAAADSKLQPIANTQDNVRQQFNGIVASINNSIDILIANPLTLGFQTTQMIQSPARASTNIQARLDAYSDLSTSIISGDGAVVKPTTDPSASNEFHTNDLYASTYVTGSIVSVVNNQFVTKVEALEAAEDILIQFQGVTDWRDDNFESLEEVDSGTSYQQLQEAVALVAGFLVQISFSLKQERRIALDRNRTIIDLTSELYGTTDNDDINFLINSNNLSGSDILELQKGHEIVYYV